MGKFGQNEYLFNFFSAKQKQPQPFRIMMISSPCHFLLPLMSTIEKQWIPHWLRQVKSSHIFLPGTGKGIVSLKTATNFFFSECTMFISRLQLSWLPVWNAAYAILDQKVQNMIQKERFYFSTSDSWHWSDLQKLLENRQQLLTQRLHSVLTAWNQLQLSTIRVSGPLLDKDVSCSNPKALKPHLESKIPKGKVTI